MAEALISIVLDRLAGVAGQLIGDQMGVEDEIKGLMDTLQSIQDVVEDAERKQVKEKSVQRWLERLKNVAYEMDDVVDEWSATLHRLQIEQAETSASTSKRRKVTDSISSVYRQVNIRLDIASKIKSIKQQLDAINDSVKMFNFAPTRIEKPLHPITTSRVDISEIRGREMDKKTIIAHLLGEKGEQSSGIYIVSIVGTGGMGKTTLAQLAFNYPEVKAHFDRKIWVCVSDPFEPTRIFRDIIEFLKKTSPNLHSLAALQQRVETCISGKKFLLVLDDVWTEDHQLWDLVKSTFLSGAGGSRILVTTRKDTVARMMRSTYMHQLGELSPDESRALFSLIAFSEMSEEKEDEFKAIGEGIADKCKGLPLAVKTMGNLMRSKNSIEEWEAVLNNELWKERSFERDISPALWLSYYDLPPAVKRCFSFCAVFPKDKRINRDELIKLWMAHNYLKPIGSKEMEMIGREYFQHLAAASFFQDFKKYDDDNVIECKMHDIVHDFAQLLAKDECAVIESGRQSERSMGNNRHATFIVQNDADYSVLNSAMKNLRTLQVLDLKLCEFIPISHHTLLVPNLCELIPISFQELKCLRALSLRNNYRVKGLPSEVGEMIHLRYLDLSGCYRLKELPETICNLHNLQTLNIDRCRWLKLPHAMHKLINLRHLQNLVVTCMPKGIGRWTSLQTLRYFIISKDEEDKCKIGDLRYLNKLRGELHIRWSSNEKDASEVEEAELEKKIHIQKLRLSIAGDMTKGVAEAIKLPPNLKELILQFYSGAELPGCMMRLSSLTRLKRLELGDLMECEHLPPLGEVPALESLQIERINNLTCVGDEFLGSSSSKIAFPKLKELQFLDMKAWEKWEVREDIKRPVMPSLKFLLLRYLPKLKSLPDHLLQMTELRGVILSCPDLRQRYEESFPNFKFRNFSSFFFSYK